MIVAACVLFGIALSFMIMPRKASSNKQDYLKDFIAANADSAISEEENEQPVLEVTEKQFFNETLKEYTYTGPVDSDGLPNGRGTAILKTGQTYKGPFEHGVFQGENVEFVFSNGDVFKGSFKNNLFDYGVLTKALKDEKFEGVFKNGQPFTGTWYTKNGKTIEKVIGNSKK